MADRPILFSAPMVRALLDDRKTQTRRILKPQPNMLNGGKPLNNGRGSYSVDGGWKRIPIAAGDRLYVREHWRVSQKWDGTPPRDLPMRSMTIFCEAGGSIANQASGRWEPDNDYPHYRPEWVGKHRQAMHMPRWASRLTLIVTDVRVERLQDISEEDAIAEGAFPCANGWTYGGPPLAGSTARGAYYCLWNSINGEGSWEANPWVAAYTFRVIRQNIDQVERVAA
jgi:hypothetical protein